jgi:copper(I)-binding protein
MRILSIALLCLLALPQAVPAHDFTVQGLSIVHPWIPEPPPGAPAAAGYMVVINNGGGDDRLIGANAEFAGHTDLHSMSVTDEGVMEMRPLKDGLPIPSGETVALEPGGVHIMFMDLVGTLREGERHYILLEFEKAGPVSVEFVVQKREDGMGMTMEEHS